MKSDIETLEVRDEKRIIVCLIKRKKCMKTVRMRMTQVSTVTVSCAISTPQFLIKRIVLDNISSLERSYAKIAERILPSLSLSDKHKYSNAVLDIVHERSKMLAESLFNIANKISIGSSRTRWGSCDARRNLRFHYKLAFLPPHLADYVIVHELCHLVELNHSVKFWHLVRQYLPNALSLRRELKRYNLE